MTTYPGGKNGSGVYQSIINQMPPHDIYIEAFLGGGAIMRYKRPARFSFGIDIDPYVIAEWIDHPERPDRMSVFCRNSLDYLRSNDLRGALAAPDTLLYLDPPYLMSTRRQQTPLYHYEMTEAQHTELLKIISGMGCMVMISGYESDLYEQHIGHWRKITFQAQTRSGVPATETLWMNYPEPKRLHDYSFLGCDYRERERIKRKRQRWVSRLKKMPSLERYAIVGAIEEYLS